MDPNENRKTYPQTDPNSTLNFLQNLTFFYRNFFTHPNFFYSNFFTDPNLYPQILTLTVES